MLLELYIFILELFYLCIILLAQNYLIQRPSLLLFILAEAEFKTTGALLSEHHITFLHVLSPSLINEIQIGIRRIHHVSWPSRDESTRNTHLSFVRLPGCFSHLYVLRFDAEWISNTFFWTQDRRCFEDHLTMGHACPLYQVLLLGPFLLLARKPS